MGKVKKNLELIPLEFKRDGLKFSHCRRSTRQWFSKYSRQFTSFSETGPKLHLRVNMFVLRTIKTLIFRLARRITLSQRLTKILNLCRIK